jgi:hypothetical protein
MFDDFQGLDSAALVAVVESSHREESALVARRMAAVPDGTAHRVPSASARHQTYNEREYGP